MSWESISIRSPWARISIRLPEELLAAIDAATAATGESRSSAIRRACAEWCVRQTAHSVGHFDVQASDRRPTDGPQRRTIPTALPAGDPNSALLGSRSRKRKQGNKGLLTIPNSAPAPTCAGDGHADGPPPHPMGRLNEGRRPWSQLDAAERQRAEVAFRDAAPARWQEMGDAKSWWEAGAHTEARS
jgi:Arc/MetJ-type ribon-helix-helix transcriptional regulator